MIQMRLWHHDCAHKYVIVLKRTKRRSTPQMVCVTCGQDVDHTSILRKAAEELKAKRVASSTRIT